VVRVALPYRIALAVVVSAGIGVPLSVHERQVRDERLTARFAAVAAGLADPAGLRPGAPHRDCGGRAIVRCATTADPDVEKLAYAAHAALGEATGEDAVLRCDHLPGGARAGGPALVGVPRSCSVVVTELGHGVAVFVDTRVDHTGGRPRLAGSHYRVDAW
jgi:hypothetical protein